MFYLSNIKETIYLPKAKIESLKEKKEHLFSRSVFDIRNYGILQSISFQHFIGFLNGGITTLLHREQLFSYQ